MFNLVFIQCTSNYISYPFPAGIDDQLPPVLASSMLADPSSYFQTAAFVRKTLNIRFGYFQTYTR